MIKAKTYIILISIFVLSSCNIFGNPKLEEEKQDQNKKIELEAGQKNIKKQASEKNKQANLQEEKAKNKEKKMLEQIIDNGHTKDEKQNKTVEELTKDLEDTISIEEILWEDIMSIELE